MKNDILAKRLEELLEATLALAAPGTPIQALSEHVIAENRELIDELMEDWRVRFITGMLRRKQEQLAREQRSAQLMLPGFERLPGQITVSEGRRRPLDTATFNQLREYLVVLRRRQRDNKRIAQIQSLMALMKKWKKKLKGKAHGLTVAEVMQREAGL